jgi:heptosyltransferase-2
MAERERLLVRAPNWIGDAVISLGFLAALRKRRPEAEVSVLANLRVSGVFRGHPAVGGLIDFRQGESLFSAASRARGREFGICYVLPLSFSSAAVAFLAGIPARIGYDAEWRGWLLTKGLRYHRKGFRSRHLLEGYCRLLGEDAKPEDPEISLSPEETAAAAGWLEKRGLKGPLAGFGPGATFGPAKRWPRERWIGLGRRLAERGGEILAFGSDEEQGLCREIADGIGRGAVSCAGETDLRQSAALLSKCGLFVTNDTGAMHLAAASGSRVVALFGSTNPAWTRPWGRGHSVLYTKEPCSPCYRRTCRFGHYRCLDGITVDEVLEAIDKPVEIR